MTNKPRAAGSEEPKPLSPTAYTLGRAHTCPKCEHSNIPCPENRRAAPVASQVAAPKRPERLQAWVTGKRVKTVQYGIKVTSDYTENAEAYMDYLEGRIRELEVPTQAADGWTPIAITSRQDIKAARLVDGKVQFLVRIEGMKDYVLDDLHPDNHLRMYLEASYWQQKCFALEKERDEFERKGKDLCSAYGESLIKVADLEAELKALRGAAE